MKYAEFFSGLTGFTPNPFQERVADALLAERNVVLCAPTGSGKTWATVAPFLYSVHCGKPVADRLLYALPLRSLATLLYESTREKVSTFELTQCLADRVRMQTGEKREDALFEGLATFTTIDQLLSGYLLHPVGLPSKLGNINAGALLGSLICFDEFHLLEPERSMATAIEMLETLAVTHPLSRFVLMTATLSSETMEWLAEKLNAVLIDVPKEEAAELPSHVGKVRRYRWVDEPLSAAAVARQHGGARTIVIANTVARAQQLYLELTGPECRQLLGEDTQIRLLHSRFLAKDRQRIEANLADWFGPSPMVTNAILVATQVIEAGLDFSCDNLHTEVAPLNAVVQRAGRCARRANQTGTVWCYALPQNDTGRQSYGPYKDVAELVDATAAALNRQFRDAPAPLQFHEERNLVDEVHTAWELRQLKFISLEERCRQVRQAMDAYDPSAVRNLVRDIASINVVITDAPGNLEFNRRKWPEMLSVPPMSLLKLFETPPPQGGWIAKRAEEQEVFDGGAIKVDWPQISSRHELMTAGWLIAIHPDFASYDPGLGLMLGRGGPTAEIEYRQRPAYQRYSYKKEEYTEHIRRVRVAGVKRDPEYRICTSRLASLLQVDERRLSYWLDLVYRLHDVGKLSMEWQKAIWKWQEQKTGSCAERPPLAHSDYDPSEDWKLKPVMRPPHAAEGAYASARLLQTAFDTNDDGLLLRSPLTAIARHHSAFTSGLTSFRLPPAAAAVVRMTLDESATEVEFLPPPTPVCCRAFAEHLVEACAPEQAKALLLYFYLVRRLRLADQTSFQEA